MNQLFFETVALATQQFPTFQQEQKTETCEYKGHRYKIAGTANQQHNLKWRLIELVKAIGAALLSVIGQSTREQASAHWNGAKTGIEKIEVCVKLTPEEMDTWKISETLKTISSLTIKSIFETSTHQDITALTKQAEESSSAFREIAENVPSDKIPTVLMGIGENTEKLSALFEFLLDDKDHPDRLVAFLQQLNPEQKSLLYAFKRPIIWKQTLPFFALANSPSFPSDFVEACRKGIQKATTFSLLYTDTDLKGLLTLNVSSEDLAKFIGQNKRNCNFMFICEQVFSAKITTIPYEVFSAIVAPLILGHSCLGAEQMARLKELIRNACADTNLKELGSDYVYLLLWCLQNFKIENIPNCFELLSDETIRAWMRDSTKRDHLLHALKTCVSSETERCRLLAVYFDNLDEFNLKNYIQYSNSPEDDYTFLLGCPDSLSSQSQHERLGRWINGIQPYENYKARITHLIQKVNTEQLFQLLLHGVNTIGRKKTLAYSDRLTAYEAFVDDPTKLNAVIEVTGLISSDLDDFLSLKNNYFFGFQTRTSCENLLTKLKIAIIDQGKKEEILNFPSCPEAVKTFLMH